ncbi:hypothetical protein PS1_003874 [Malus domestica]
MAEVYLLCCHFHYHSVDYNVCQLNEHYQSIIVWEVNSLSIMLGETNNRSRFGIVYLNLGNCYNLPDLYLLGLVCGPQVFVLSEDAVESDGLRMRLIVCICVPPRLRNLPV